jgi:dolichol-phosphate mannosyltransferase
MISIILPTFCEADNIGPIINNIFNMLEKTDIKGQIVVVDDNSPDGTADVAQNMAKEYPVRVHVRKNQRGLATAVMKGFELADGDIFMVMDADMSHPVEKIPDMINPILRGECDGTVGTRYIGGGECENWPLIRKIVSKGAGLLAKGVTGLSDPTSGFMAIRSEKLEGVQLDPIGWKIVLEVIVKTNCRYMEVPISFSDREKGESKLNFNVQIDYIRHLWRLYCFRYRKISQFVKFCLVGLSGLIVDTAVLISFVELLSFDPRIAAIIAFVVAVTWNYLLNRVWTFEHAQYIKISYSYSSFVMVCLLGLGVRIGIMHLLIEYGAMGKGRLYVLASIIGIIAATVFNFLGSKYVAFRKCFSC